MLRSGIYKIVCAPTEKCYVGSTVNFGTRWSKHKSELTRGIHHSPALQNSWNKYGPDAFEFVIVERCARSLLIEREQHFLDEFMPFGERGFNILRKSLPTPIGFRHTEAQLAKMRGKKIAPATIEKMRAARLANNHQVGRPLTDKQKAALWKSGENHPWYGRSHSNETRLKISAKKARPVAQCDESGAILTVWPSVPGAAAALGLMDCASIHRSIRTKGKRAAVHCRWRYATEEELREYALRPRPALPSKTEPHDWAAILPSARERGLSTSELARELECSKSAVERAVDRLCAPKLRDGRKPRNRAA